MVDFTTFDKATDAILGTLKTYWDAHAGSVNGSVVPTLVYEFLESDLKPHPRDTSKPWARVVVRHGDGNKVTLNNSDGVARYRRLGVAWVQVFVPAAYGSAWTVAQQLAAVAQFAYEGKRALDGTVVFTKVTMSDHARDGASVRKDVKVYFYWDDVR